MAIVLTGLSLQAASWWQAFSSVWVTLSLVVFVYGMDSLMDEESLWPASRTSTGCLLWLILIAGLVLAGLRSSVTLWSALIIVALGLSYNYPFQRAQGIFRLKSLTGLKSLWIGGGWAMLVYLGAAALEASYVHVVASFVALQVTVSSVLRDLHDVEEDQKNGTRTLPLVLGERTTYTVLHILNLMSGVLLLIFPVPWSTLWLAVLVWRALNLEWLRWGQPGHWATQYMNLATCGWILIMKVFYYVMA